MRRGWSNVKGYRCRSAHIVSEDNTVALCGSPVRTLYRPRGAPTELCDHCQAAKKRRKGKP